MAAWGLLLLLVARPAWLWTVVRWERPLLVVALDQSRSMGIVDAPHNAAAAFEALAEGDAAPSPLSRAEHVNRRLHEARAALNALEEWYEVRRVALGHNAVPLDAWRIEPRDDATPIAETLEAAGRQRSRAGDPPRAIVLISDGAENVAGAAEVRAAAERAVTQGTAILALGAGPSQDQAPAVIFAAIDVPQRIRTRQTVQIHAAARVRGCAGATVAFQLRVDDAVLHEHEPRIGRADQEVALEHPWQPAEPGVYRVTARAALPAALGGAVFEQSRLVQVRGDRLRVLHAYGQPHTEAAFTARALRGDAAIELESRLLAAERGGERPEWSAYDVVLLGLGVEAVLTPADAEALAQAVQSGGTGMLLAGGRELFESRPLARTTLAEVCPVALGTTPRPIREARPLPTSAGLRHPVLAISDDAAARKMWEELPPLANVVALQRPAALATTLAADLHGEPLLVVQEAGAGRCAAAGWEQTWPWALASDEGFALHQRTWRQLVAWLANRRPRPWVVTDRLEYPHGLLASGGTRIVIHAGVEGWEAAADGAAALPEVRLRMRHMDRADAPPSRDREEPLHPSRDREGAVASTVAATDEPGAAATQTRPTDDTTWEIPLRRRAGRWEAVLPSAAVDAALLEAGTYELVFEVVSQEAQPGNASISPARQDGADIPSVAPHETRDDAPRATTRFRIADIDIELLPPTSDLELLAQCATITSAAGGRYAPIDSLGQVLAELVQRDPRRRIEQPAEYDVVRRMPWTLLAVLAAALGLEWALRRRAGLV